MRPKRVLPWLISAAIHAATIVGVLLLATVGVDAWQRAVPSEVERSAIITLGEPASSLARAQPSLDEDPPAPSAASLPEKGLVPRRSLAGELAHDATRGTSAKSTLPWARRALPLPTDVVSIAGVRQEAARRVVFLLDGSGSMTGALPTAIGELSATIGRLSDEQSFAVFAFQAGASRAVPPAGLRRAGPVLGQRGIDAMANWLDEHVVPSGSSDPRAAIRDAVALKPDCIVIVSAGLLGVADSPADRDALLADLETLNPRDPRTKRRPISFACIHLLEPEPLGALEAIAAEHGGQASYRFIERLSDLAAPAEAPLRRDDTTLSVERAAAELAGPDAARARLVLLRIGLGQPLHHASPLALVCAAEYSLAHDGDAAAALALASAATQSAKSFGLSTTQDRAATLARTAHDALRQHPPRTSTP